MNAMTATMLLVAVAVLLLIAFWAGRPNPLRLQERERMHAEAEEAAFWEQAVSAGPERRTAVLRDSVRESEDQARIIQFARERARREEAAVAGDGEGVMEGR